MARYRVKVGHILPHDGVVLEGGAELELPPHVADDIEIRHRLDPVAVEVAPSVAVRDWMRSDGVDLVVDELEDGRGVSSPVPSLVAPAEGPPLAPPITGASPTEE